MSVTYRTVSLPISVSCQADNNQDMRFPTYDKANKPRSWFILYLNPMSDSPMPGNNAYQSIPLNHKSGPVFPAHIDQTSSDTQPYDPSTNDEVIDGRSRRLEGV